MDYKSKLSRLSMTHFIHYLSLILFSLNFAYAAPQHNIITLIINDEPHFYPALLNFRDIYSEKKLITEASIIDAPENVHCVFGSRADFMSPVFSANNPLHLTFNADFLYCWAHKKDGGPKVAVEDLSSEVHFRTLTLVKGRQYTSVDPCFEYPISVKRAAVIYAPEGRDECRLSSQFNLSGPFSIGSPLTTPADKVDNVICYNYNRKSLP